MSENGITDEDLFDVPELDEPEDANEADTEEHGPPANATDDDVDPVEDDELDEADTDPDEDDS